MIALSPRPGRLTERKPVSKPNDNNKTQPNKNQNKRRTKEKAGKRRKVRRKRRGRKKQRRKIKSRRRTRERRRMVGDCKQELRRARSHKFALESCESLAI